MSPSLITLNGSRDLAGALKAQMAKDIAAEMKVISQAHTSAAKEVMTSYLGELRSDVSGTGFRNASKLANTWRGRVYPTGSSTGPAIFIWNRAKPIIDAFSLGLSIRALSGKFLAIPVGAAIPIVQAMNKAENRSRDGGGRFQTENGKAQRVAAALGVRRLDFIPPQGGKPGLLVSPDKQVLFILVKQVLPPKRMQGRALLKEFDARFGADFAAALARYV